MLFYKEKNNIMSLYGKERHQQLKTENSKLKSWIYHLRIKSFLKE